MTPSESARSALRRLAWVCLVLVLAVTTLSAYMRLAKDGLGCQPWPQCHAQRATGQAGATPDATGTPAVAAARLAHRIAAVAVLLLVIAMLAIALATRPRWRADTLLLIALLVATLWLAVLGRWTAQSRLPAVVLGNLLGGFVLLALCLRLAAPARPGVHAGLRSWIGLAVLLVLAQIALGGMVSATSSLLACGSLGDCWAAAQGQSWLVLDPWRIAARADASAASQGAPLQWLHRLGALLVLLYGLMLALLMRPRDRIAATLLLACLLAQALLGPLLGVMAAPMVLALLHNVLAATILALLARWL